MKLSAPIHVLKGQAKRIKVEQSLSMTEALNQIAKKEGYSSWSLLQSKQDELYPNSYDEVLDFFNPGDFVIVGARPSMGKTSFTVGMFVRAINRGKAKHFFFSLAEIHKDIAGRMAIYDESLGQNNNLFELDYSDEISGDYIINKTRKEVSEGSVIVIDYLQLLDQRRANPELQVQIDNLTNYAKETGCIIIFLSQVDRNIEYKGDQRPTLEDINLPNALDLKSFNKIIFLYRKTKESTETEVLFRRPRDFGFIVNWNPKTIKFS
jgi:replicative DNA helicase